MILSDMSDRSPPPICIKEQLSALDDYCKLNTVLKDVFIELKKLSGILHFRGRPHQFYQNGKKTRKSKTIKKGQKNKPQVYSDRGSISGHSDDEGYVPRRI